MVEIARLDLASPLFWVVVVPLVPVAAVWSGPGRPVALAAIHVVFLWFVLGPTVAVTGLVVVLALWAAARALGAGGGVGPLWALVVGLVAVFVVNKLPWAGLSGVQALLGGIGFSYVFLRAIDMLRVVQEGVRPAPTLAGAIGYLVPFHMLAAGPIQAYTEFVDAGDAPPPTSVRRVLQAFERIAAGLFKKYVLAQALREIFLTGFQAEGLYFVVEVQLHFLWVFLDFSAYSDIAVGLGALMGIRTPENFDRPLTARNMIVFWERWHITLSEWIRRNLFVPVQLGLVRRYPDTHALVPATVAFTVAFVLCGLWHGLTWRFALWGLSQAVGLVICNAYRYWLRRRLGRDGVKRYLASAPVRWAATLLTFEFMAFSIAFSLWPR